MEVTNPEQEIDERVHIKNIQSIVGQLGDSDKSIISDFRKNINPEHQAFLNDHEYENDTAETTVGFEKSVGAALKKLARVASRKNVVGIKQATQNLDSEICHRDCRTFDSLYHLLGMATSDRSSFFREKIRQKILEDNQLLDRVPYESLKIKDLIENGGHRGKLRAEIIRAKDEQTEGVEIQSQDGEFHTVYVGGSRDLVGIVNNEKSSIEQEKTALIQAVLAPVIEINQAVDGNGRQIFPVSAIVYCGSSVDFQEGVTKKPWDLDIVVIFKKRFDYRSFLMSNMRDNMKSFTDRAWTLLTNLASYDETNKRTYTIVGDKITEGHQIDITYFDEERFKELFDMSGEVLEQELKMTRETMLYRNPKKQKALDVSGQHMNFVRTIAAHSGTIIWGDSPTDSNGNPIIKEENRNLVADILKK